MKRLKLLLHTVLMSMVCIEALAYDIAVNNEEGITIYYNFINGGSELEITSNTRYNPSDSHIRTYGYEGFESITVPSIVNYSGKVLKVTGIGAHAFDCFSGWGYSMDSAYYKIRSIVLPDNIAYIGENAFEGCRDLQSIVLPSEVKAIGNGAFSRTGLVSIVIPNSVTEIGIGAFSFCDSLEKICFTNSTVSIKIQAFRSCPKLNTIEYLSEDISAKGPLYDFSSSFKDTIVVPEKAYQNLKENSEWDKYDRIFARGADKRLYLGIRNDYNSIVGVNGINDKNLILVPHDEEAVLQRSNSSSNEIYVTMNGESSVLTPDNPKMFVKPSSLHSLENNIIYVIDRDVSEENDYNIVMPSSGKLLSLIGKDNLELVKRLKVVGDINGTDILAIRNMSSLEELDLSVANIVKGGTSYFDNYITSANTIGNSFFKDMSNLIVLYLPKNGTSILSNVFDGCTKLQEIIIPHSFASIGPNAFSNSGIKKVVLEESTGTIKINTKAFENTSISTLELYRDYTGSLFGNIEALQRLTVDGPQTSINEEFQNCNNLSTLIIGSNIKYITLTTFINFKSLEKVIFKDSNIKIELYNSDGFPKGPHVLFENSPIKELYWGRDIYGDYSSNHYSYPFYPYGVFMNLPYLTNLSIGDAITKIPSQQFKGDIGLKKVSLPDGITEIGSSAFDGCSSLVELSMPNQLKYIEAGAFANCEVLKSIEIPETVASIGDSAFAYCKSISFISIGKNVGSIRRKTFKGCSSLQEIRLGDKITSIGDNAFE
ncbi:MAG: leucine-rich repeat domain-containing protein [Bacteroidales bacterium]|nr:leucine-rich repeat domain-containing protein [Bacteroidales bacterium]